MRTLLIDNYDSYTYNLFQVLAEVNGELPLVYYNDNINLEQIKAMVQAGTVHSIVISPGPGTPSNSSDIGVCMNVLQQLPDLPILGICLGHQALSLAHGASVVAAPEPVHGRLSRLRHSGHGLFKDIPSGDGFEVVRYHSLLVDERSLPDCLEAVCWTTGNHSAVKLARDAIVDTSADAPNVTEQHTSGEQLGGQAPRLHQQKQGDEALACSSVGLLMGLAHRSRPHYGVQFHPESVATQYGIALLRNFRDLAAEHIRRRGGPAAEQLPPAIHVANLLGPPGRLPAALPPWPTVEHQRVAKLRLLWSRMEGLLQRLPGGSQDVFEALYGWETDTFWLDSAAADRGRFSYMGGRGGSLWLKLTYKLPPPSTSAPGLAAALKHSEPLAAVGQSRRWDGTDHSKGPSKSDPDAEGNNLPVVTAAADLDSDMASSSSFSTVGDVSCASWGPAASTGAASSCTGGTMTVNTAATESDSVAAVRLAGSSTMGDNVLMVETPDGRITRVAAPFGFLGHLQSLLERQRVIVEADIAEALPFNFWGGLVGYLGYELKAECGGMNAHAATTHDAVMFLADRLVACDHATGDVYLLALYDSAILGDGVASGVDVPVVDGDGDRSPDLEVSKAAAWCGPVLKCGEAQEGSCIAEGRIGSEAAGADEQKSQAQMWLQKTQQVLEGVEAEAAGEAATARSREICAHVTSVTAQRTDAPPPLSASPPPRSNFQGDERNSPTAPTARSDTGCGDIIMQRPGGSSEGVQEDGGRCLGSALGSTVSVLASTASHDAPQHRQQHQHRHPQQQSSLAGSAMFGGSHSQAAWLASEGDGRSAACQVASRSSPELDGSSGMVPFTLAHGRSAYLRNIAACHAALHAGETYEVCLTTALTRPVVPCPAQLYRRLRKLNPAPYAAWLQCGSAGPTICCSSPERFLRGDRGGMLEARPIKGTAARVVADPWADAAAAAELASSEKERAENLMIVDLLRNDLGRVCEVGTVHVPGLMDIESYATVHQMVSTVRGVRRAGMSIIDCIRAAFPGGSMTGAPKVRTMQIIDALEDRARGVYSGSIGFISLNDTFDLNIVIRTAVIEDLSLELGLHLAAEPTGSISPADPDAALPMHEVPQLRPRRVMTIGAGGAIVVQSKPDAEYEEMRLKAQALLRAVGLCEGAMNPVPVVSN